MTLVKDAMPDQPQDTRRLELNADKEALSEIARSSYSERPYVKKIPSFNRVNCKLQGPTGEYEKQLPGRGEGSKGEEQPTDIDQSFCEHENFKRLNTTCPKAYTLFYSSMCDDDTPTQKKTLSLKLRRCKPNKENSAPPTTSIPKLNRKSLPASLSPAIVPKKPVIHKCFAGNPHNKPPLKKPTRSKTTTSRDWIRTPKSSGKLGSVGGSSTSSSSRASLLDLNETYRVTRSLTEKALASKQDHRGRIAEDKDRASMRTFDLQELDGCNLLVLVKEEFIDDDYDSYIETTDKGQLICNKELFEMTKNLVRIFLDADAPLKKKQCLGRSFMNKLFNGRKTASGAGVNSERIVTMAMDELKQKFEAQVHKKLEEKLDKLLKEVTEQIGQELYVSCQETVARLVKRFEGSCTSSI